MSLIPSTEDQGSMQKRWRKDFKIQRWWMAPRKQCLPDTTGWMHTQTTDTVTAHIRSAQVQIRQYSSTEKGKWTQSSAPNQDAISYWCMLKKEISFLWWSVTRSIWHTPGETSCSGAGGPLKSDSYVFVCFVLFVLTLASGMSMAWELPWRHSCSTKNQGTVLKEGNTVLSRDWMGSGRRERGPDKGFLEKMESLAKQITKIKNNAGKGLGDKSILRRKVE